jgi:predicted DNA-binding transcriptional regulator AlpA
MTNLPGQFARLSLLSDRYGISISTLYRIERTDSNFPRARILPTGARLWSVKELDEYFHALPTENKG